MPVQISGMASDFWLNVDWLQVHTGIKRPELILWRYYLLEQVTSFLPFNNCESSGHLELFILNSVIWMSSLCTSLESYKNMTDNLP